jgi:glycosyltransferase involved in cell wall biosynthesis
LPETTFHKNLLKFLRLKVQVFLAVSLFIKEALVRAGVPERSVVHVLSGIYLENSNRDFAAKRSDETKRLPQVSIGIIGQVGKWKGHEDLIQAMSILKNKGLPFVCRVYGTGDVHYITLLKSQIQNLGLDRYFEWAGFVEDRETIFNNIDICVVPSRISEAFGMVAAEAAWFGVPTVATRVGALGEIIKDGETGYLVGLMNIRQLAEKIELLTESRELRERMGSAARKYASEHLTSSRMVEEIESILVAIVRRNQGT